MFDDVKRFIYNLHLNTDRGTSQDEAKRDETIKKGEKEERETLFPPDGNVCNELITTDTYWYCIKI